jgi:hypothetical protein
MRNHALGASLLLMVVGCHRSIVSAPADPAVASSEPVDAATLMAMGMADLTPTADPAASAAAKSDAPASPNKVALPVDDTIPKDFRINFNRSLCQGPCTSFDASIDAQGNITLTGSAYENHNFNRPIKGCATKHIGTKGVVAIIAMLKKDNFSALREVYGSNRSEQQAEFVYVSMNHTYQSVEHAIGAEGDPLDAASIKAIEDIDAKLEQITGAAAFVAAPKSMPCKK